MRSNSRGAAIGRDKRLADAKIPSRRQRGFSLVELMIVVFLLTVLLGIAIPGFVNSRQKSRQRTCVSNLRTLDQSKEQYAMENRLAPGDEVTMEQLSSPYLRGRTPECPSGGTYTLNPVGAVPTCTEETANPPHVVY